MIPDEIVEKAHRALIGHQGVAIEDAVRAALEAVEPDLTAAARAEGMEEAARIIDALPAPVCYAASKIYARADAIRSSLKPKATGEG